MPLRFDNPLYEGNLLFDSTLNFPAGGQGQTISVDINENINLKWGATHELAVTTPDGAATLAGVTLIEPTGWEYITFDGSTLDPATTESFQEYTPADLGITLAAGDLIAIQSNAAITDLRTDGTFLVSPAQDIAANPYKIWDDSAATWSALSTFSITDLGEFVPPDDLIIPPEYRYSVGKVGYYLVKNNLITRPAIVDVIAGGDSVVAGGDNVVITSSTGVAVGNVNEAVYDWLVEIGIEGGNINDMMYNYLEGLGYTGTMNTKYYKWRQDP